MANILDTSLALGSVPYNFAKGIIGNPSNPGATTQVSLTNAQKDYLDNIAKSKGPSGTIDYSDYGSPTKTFSGISNMNPMEVSLATTMGGTGYTTNPDGSINYTGGAYDFNKGNVITDFIDKGGIIGAADRFGKNIYDKLNPTGNIIQLDWEDEDEYDFSGIEGQTAYLGLPQLFGMIMKGGVSKNALQKALIKDQISKQIGKKVIGPKIIKKLKESAGVEFGGTGKFKNISTSNKDYGPYKKSTPAPEKKYTSPARPHGNGGGGGGGGQKGSMPTGTAGRNPWGRADGGLINFYRYGGFV